MSSLQPGYSLIIQPLAVGPNWTEEMATNSGALVLESYELCALELGSAFGNWVIGKNFPLAVCMI